MKFFKNNFVFLVIAFLLLAPEFALAESADVFALNAERLHNKYGDDLSKAGWRYKPGAGEAAWAATDFDDRDWEKLNDTRLYTANLPSAGWTGAAWFRLRVSIDEPLAREPLALHLFHWGASEIYLDGKLIRSFGKIAADGDANGEVEENPIALPVPMMFETSGEHVIAVRYSLSAARDLSKGTGAWLARGLFSAGINVFVQNANGAVKDTVEYIRDASRYKFFIGVSYAFALLHFLLFLFYRQERANLFYSLFVFNLANGSLFFNIVNGGSQTAVVSAVLFILFASSYAAALLALQAFLYEAFTPRFSKLFWLSAACWLALSLLLIVFVRQILTLYATTAFLFVSLSDSLRLIVSAVRRRRDGAWIIAGGVLTLGVGVALVVLNEFRFFENPRWYQYASDVGVFLAVPVAVSIYLARNFARTNRHLAAQLVQVKELSEKELEQSRRAAALSLEREKEKVIFTIIEAENERRAQELEEARQLQLSMLPKKLPQIPNLEIAAYMKPAAEVGGDYYDFHTSADGTLTVAVGDATGHGLKAGSIVTAAKGLFRAFADEPQITEIFRRSSRALKEMNLRGLFMAMTVLKIKDDKLQISSAGMPATLVFRRATKRVEEVFIKAMPLGSVVKFPYERRDLNLSSGDVIVTMSDGFPEMFNPQDEMLGFDEAAKVLSEIADKSPQEIVNRFVAVGERWANDRPADDDVTFVVLKIV